MENIQETTPTINYKRNKFSDDQLLDLYRNILKPRMIEEKMLNLLRQGRISKWFSGIGQEAISVATAWVLEKDEYILPMHRNLGVFTTRNVLFTKLFMQWQGKVNGFSKARERSFHFGTNEYHIIGMISHLGPQLTIADGIGLASKLANDGKVTAVFTGEGGTSEGDFHEALNVASVWDLPVLFIIENNGYGLSTPTNEQYRCEKLADRGIGYGMQAITVDGNNILEMVQTIKDIRAQMLIDSKPVLLECNTFRMRGHEEASGVKYVPKELLEIWGKKDPVINYETYLYSIGLLNDALKQEYKSAIVKEIESGIQAGFAEPEPTANTEDELQDVYAPHTQIITEPKVQATTQKRMVDAISDALWMAMKKHEHLVLMGQDIAEYGGVFKITERFVEEFGRHRVRNTPICESAILGAAIGLSIKGMKSMVEMQFADFVTSGFNQVVNNIAKMHYRWGQHVDTVIRMPTGAGVGAGPFHSQSNEAWFFHTPGLKIVYPSNAADAKGLLLAAFEDPNPVMFFEHKALYRSNTADVPDDYFTIPIGQANWVKEGNDISIITYGMGVQWALKFLEKHPDISADVLDLRTLMPFDKPAINTTVNKTGKVIVLHEDTLTGGIGAEIAAYISEHLFQHLDAPVMRCASLDTPVPFAIPLEQNFLPEKRFEEMVRKLLEW
ncbi:MAG TPA: dehydrogenase E1 component subunit alpha/beta [Chitinophagales bacterium]|nr:dehydrogenase E1 component subunit alpha/beta [Chitinophagales bacterium]